MIFHIQPRKCIHTYVCKCMKFKMNSEESRLLSFNLWSNNDLVCIRTLSANGFYATGNDFEVECNWCHSRITDWQFNENIEQRHIRLNPNCEFLINKEQSGNIALTTSNDVLQMQNHQTVNDFSTVAKRLDLLTEKDRLATFVNWPNPNITPQSLAKAGFFYRDKSDEVECAWCKGVIAKWEKQDNAFEEHRRFFPECPRVQLGPLIEISNEGIRDLGIQQISNPKNPKFSSLQTRLRTYSNWPIPDIQRPENLAQAGLYYQNIDDQVRCFHCNMGLRLWEKKDDPWFEHAKWYPMCDFVRLVKGVNYIQEVQEYTISDQTTSNAILPMTIEKAMGTEPVKLALEMGINIETLRIKLRQKILATGRQYDTIDDLLKAVFDEQENVNFDLENTARNSNSLNKVTAVNNAVISNNTSGNDKNLEQVSDIQKITGKKFPGNVSSKLKINHTENALLPSETNEKATLDRKFLEEENRKLKDARLCKVCLDEDVGVVYLPCGHLVTCVQCAPGVDQCPMCRTKINGFVRTYLS